jgi:hypothetical protein
MSTPEPSQDPGEHGYGGTKQDFPTEDESKNKERRLEDEDEPTSEQRAGERQQGGSPPDAEH